MLKIDPHEMSMPLVLVNYILPFFLSFIILLTSTNGGFISFSENP